MNKLTITTATSEDLEEVFCLLNEITESIKSKKGWSTYLVNAQTDNQKKIFSDILESDSRVFIAKQDGYVIGLINMQIVRNIRHGWKRAHLEEVVVSKKFRRKGVGSKLISAVVDYCRGNKITVIKLLCGKQLTDAQKFYEKNGFESTDEGYRLEVE